MIPQAERSFLRRQVAIFLTILFFLYPGAAAAQIAAGTITGVVRSVDAVLPNMAVGIYPANDATSTWLKAARTNTEGVFSFTGLAAGSYKIYFFSSGTNYISGWYKKNTVPSPGSAVEAFSEGSVITLTTYSAGADVGKTQLNLGLTITGKVIRAAVEPAVGIAGVFAQAYIDNGTTWVKSSAVTPAEGTYTISGLRAGSYKIRFYAYGTAYTTAWYSSTESPTNTVSDAASATLVAAGTSDSIDSQLSTGASISGTVSKIDGTNIVPVAGALVVVYDSAESHAFRGFIRTGDNGTYTVPGIFVPASGTGKYIVQFYEKFVNNAGEGLTEWYNGMNGAYIQSGAKEVQVTEDIDGNKSIFGIDAILDRGPISGKVSYTTGSPIAGVTVKIVVGETEKTAVTDAKGLYSIPELSSSMSYTVQFSKNGVQLGERTPVAAGATGINLQIEPPPPSNAAKLIPTYKRLLLKKRYCYIINGVRVCR